MEEKRHEDSKIRCTHNLSVSLNCLHNRWRCQVQRSDRAQSGGCGLCYGGQSCNTETRGGVAWILMGVGVEEDEKEGETLNTVTFY